MKKGESPKKGSGIDLIPLDAEASAQIRSGSGFIRFKPSKQDIIHISMAVARKIKGISGEEVKDNFDHGAHYAFQDGLNLTFALTGSCRYRVLKVGYIEYCLASNEFLLMV